MMEEVIHDESSQKTKAVRGLTGRSVPRPISDVSADAEDRIHLPIGEFARVLGGGIVPGSIVLVGGDPGIGKSTLMLQMAMEMSSRKRALYVSGEESERQIKMRAVRLNGKNELPQNLMLVTVTNLEIIFNHIREVKPELLTIDSIQTVYLSAQGTAVPSAPDGSLAEEFLLGWIHGHSAGETLEELEARSPLELFAKCLLMFLVLVPFIGAKEIGRALGPGALRRVLWERPK